MDCKNIFAKAKDRIDVYSEMLSNIEKNPEIIMTSLYENGFHSFITYVLNSSTETMNSEFDFIEFQDYLYSILLPFLKRDLDEYQFKYDGSVYPSFISVLFDNVEMGHINIYDKKFIENTHEELEKERNILRAIESSHLEIISQMIKYEEYKENLMLMSEDNVLKMIDIKMRKKKYERDVINKHSEKFDESMAIGRELSNQKSKIAYMEDELKPFEYKQEHLRKFLNRKYGYK